MVVFQCNGKTFSQLLPGTYRVSTGLEYPRKSLGDHGQPRLGISGSAFPTQASAVDFRLTGCRSLPVGEPSSHLH